MALENISLIPGNGSLKPEVTIYEQVFELNFTLAEISIPALWTAIAKVRALAELETYTEIMMVVCPWCREQRPFVAIPGGGRHVIPWKSAVDGRKDQILHPCRAAKIRALRDELWNQWKGQGNV